jgi:hypothetical protein
LIPERVTFNVGRFKNMIIKNQFNRTTCSTTDALLCPDNLQFCGQHKNFSNQGIDPTLTNAI